MKPKHPLGIGLFSPEKNVYNLCADITRLVEDTGFVTGFYI